MQFNSLHFIINYAVMVIVGMAFNPMNVLAYRLSDLYVSLTLFYGGLLMGANMIWSHEIIHYLTHGTFNKTIFYFGVVLSLIITMFLLRRQYKVSDNQWLKRMISHHSTALTTSNKILERSNNYKLVALAKQIIDTQEKEIKMMKELIE